jgi:hypothetical protein
MFSLSYSISLTPLIINTWCDRLWNWFIVRRISVPVMLHQNVGLISARHRLITTLQTYIVIAFFANIAMPMKFFNVYLILTLVTKVIEEIPSFPL